MLLLLLKILLSRRPFGGKNFTNNAEPYKHSKPLILENLVGRTAICCERNLLLLNIFYEAMQPARRGSLAGC